LEEALIQPRQVVRGAAVLQSKIYFAGGGFSGNASSKAIDVYDALTKTWDHSLELSTERRDLAAVATDELVFFAGGRATGSNQASDAVDIFDVNGFVKTISMPSGGRYNLCAVNNGSSLVYFAGGDTGVGGNDVTLSAAVDIYDTSIDNWLPPGDQLSEARRSLEAGVLDGKVYFIGGHNQSGVGTNAVDIFDGESGSPGAPINNARDAGFVAVSTPDEILVAGGRQGGVYLDIVDRITSETGRSTTNTPLSKKCFALGAAAAGNLVFFACGTTSSGPNPGFTDIVEVYNLDTDNWIAPKYLSQPRDGVAAVALGSKAYFAGGRTGTSSYSGVIDVYDPDEVKVNVSELPTVIKKEVNETVDITGENFHNVKTMEFVSVGIADPDGPESNTGLSPVGNVSTKTLTSTDITDPVGIIYHINIKDYSDREQTISAKVANFQYGADDPEQKITLVGGTNVSDYRIISVPLRLSDPGPANVFDELGAYDKTKWRLFDWKPGSNTTGSYREYTNGLNSIQPGKGYWLITRTGSVVNPGIGTTVSLTGSPPNDLYTTITLEPGWNLVGNPYNFTLSWSKVASYAENASANMGPLYLFSSGTLSVGTNLASHSGGFIENLGTSNITLKIPASKALSGGRVASPEPIDLAAHQWQIPLSLTDGELSNQTGGIGMHKQATLTGRDQFDGVSVPLLAGFGIPELVFKHRESDTDFCLEIVPTTDNYEWEFQVVNRSENQLRLEWDPSLLEEGSKELHLFDPATLDMKDMRTNSYYLVPSSSKSLRILFGERSFIRERKDELLPLFGQPYPNPAAGEVFVPFHIGENKGEVNIAIQVYDGLGRYVDTIVSDKFSPGDHQAVWNSEGRSGLFVVNMQSGDGQVSRTKVVVK
jgi:hypothetical protein